MTSSSPTSAPQPASSRELVAIAIVAWFMAMFLRLPSLHADRRDPREAIVACVAQRMTWSTSEYSPARAGETPPTRRADPYDVGRRLATGQDATLLTQPPLLPWVLKAGMTLFDPPGTLRGVPKGLSIDSPAPATSGAVLAGFLMVAIFLAAALAQTVRGLLHARGTVVEAVLVLGALAICPLNLFSTTRFHVDGLVGLSLAGLTLALSETLARPRRTNTIVATAWAIAAVETSRFGLLAFPLLGLAVIWTLNRGSGDAMQTRSRLLACGVVALAAVLASHHHLRLAFAGAPFARGGELARETGLGAGIDALIGIDRDVTAAHRPWHWLLAVAIGFPALVLWLRPAPWRAAIAAWRDDGDRSLGFVPAAAWLVFLVTLATGYDAACHAAVALPLLHVLWPMTLRDLETSRGRWTKWLLVGFTAWAMLVSGWRVTLIPSVRSMRYLPGWTYKHAPWLNGILSPRPPRTDANES